MVEAKEIELVLHTKDEQVVNAVQSALPDGVTKERVPSTRALDVVSILVTATAAVKLVSALMELRKKWKESKETVEIEVTNEKGGVLNLLEASEEMVQQFVDAS
jgi:hypothetical protein